MISQIEQILFYNSPNAIGFIDSDGKFSRSNSKWSEMFGFSESEIDVMTIFDMCHPQDIAPVKDILKKLYQKPYEARKFSMILRLLDKQGKSHWIEGFVTSYIEDSNVRFLTFYAIPLPNNGKFKVERIDDTTLQIRPSITLLQFLKDNWQWTIGFILPLFTGFLYAAFKFVSMMSLIMDRLELNW